MTQTDRVLLLLRQRGAEGITPLDALDIVGSFRLGARIYDLREAGYDIETLSVTVPSGARIARYVLHEEAQVELPW